MLHCCDTSQWQHRHTGGPTSDSELTFALLTLTMAVVAVRSSAGVDEVSSKSNVGIGNSLF